MRKPSLRRFFIAAAVVALAGCATVSERPDSSYPVDPEKWARQSGTTQTPTPPPGWPTVNPDVKSTVKLHRTEFVAKDKTERWLTTYLVTVIYYSEHSSAEAQGEPAHREPPPPYVVQYVNKAYDVVTALSRIRVPTSDQITFTVVRNSAKGDPGGSIPPPPP